MRRLIAVFAVALVALIATGCGLSAATRINRFCAPRGGLQSVEPYLLESPREGKPIRVFHCRDGSAGAVQE